jgi:hypothetical protein
VEEGTGETLSLTSLNCPIDERTGELDFAGRLGGKPKAGGRKTTLGTIIDYAADGGCPLPPDDHRGSERFQAALDKLAAEGVAETEPGPAKPSFPPFERLSEILQLKPPPDEQGKSRQPGTRGASTSGGGGKVESNLHQAKPH